MKPIDLETALSPEVKAELMRPAATFDPRAMLLSGDAPLRWYVIEIASRDAEDELIKRQFGIYVPECDEVVVRRGRKSDRRTKLFPGYVFVFMRGTGANWNRIGDIRSVITILGSLPFEAIDRIRYLENCMRPIVLESWEEEHVVMKKRKKRWRKSRHVVVVQDQVVCTRPWSAFDDAIQGLDSEARNQLLRDYLLVPAACGA